MWETLGKFTAAALAVATLIGLGYALFAKDDNKEAEGARAPRQPIESHLLRKGDGPPHEFLYLDPARTQAYLSQFQGGISTLEKSSVADSIKLGAELSAGPAKLSGEGQSEGSFERSVTPTTTSQFINLAGYLETRDLFPPLPPLAAFTTSDARAHRAGRRFRGAWDERVKERSFIRIRARITVPRFVRIYQTLRAAADGSPTAKLTETMLSEIGQDPRVPLAIVVDDGSGRPPLRVVLPLQYSLLATEPSLIIGEVTVVGKVLYRIHPKRRWSMDREIGRRYRPEIHATPLLRWLGLKPDGLAEELEDYRVVKGPAAIVLPLAIYK